MQLQNGEGRATPPPDHTTTQNDDGTTRRRGDGEDNEEAKQTKKKAQEMSFDISWAVGKFFFLVHYFVTN